MISLSTLYLIAAAEWRFWLRTRLAAAIAATGLLLVVLAAFISSERLHDLAHSRAQQQQNAHETFLDQPDRHPHRMVHYGHYVFRTPPPLAALDPGVDPTTGNAIFLEGHRQNTAMFAEAATSLPLNMFGAISPAFCLQVFAPLLLILMGFASISREYESRTLTQLLAQGQSGAMLMGGKALALFSAGLVFLAPFALSAIISGAPAPLVAFFVGGYAAYLAIWALLIVVISAVVKRSEYSLSGLLVAWLLIVVLIPRLSASVALDRVDIPGKIASDFAAHDAMKAVGDGHNANDPAFEKLKAGMLAQYGVDDISKLPMNFRGVVAGRAEANLTAVMNQFAEKRMQAEVDQAETARYFGILSPILALRHLSTSLAGVDLETHHRFLREAERVRFDFVQALNKVHAEQLAYADDIKRSSDSESEQRTRVSAANWQILEDFNFQPDSATVRLDRAHPSALMLFIWLLVLLLAVMFTGRRLS